MTKIQEQLRGIQTQQGVLGVIYWSSKKDGGECKLSSRLQRLASFGSGAMPFAEGRVSLATYIL